MSEALQHYGVRGMKWGVRRFQREDGSLTSAGRKRYADDDGAVERRKSVAKKAAIGTAAVVGVVLMAYLVKKHGAKKVSELAEKAETGKSIADNLAKSTPVMSTPIRQIQVPRAPISRVEIPRANISPPPAYDFEALMKQNDELLKKMYADLLS